MGMRNCNCATEDDPCTDDGNACTNDLCKSGICTHLALDDGLQCLGNPGQNYLCCGGNCKFTQGDDLHCGGCYVECKGALACNTGYCRSCVDDNHCSQDVSAGFTCNKSMGADRCQCDTNSSCPMPWQFCDNTHKCRGID
jgi:hypothetical protein